MYTVRHAARLTGIAPNTLRMWERRYAVVTPARSEAGYRLYDDDALRRRSAMRALVGAGWSPRQAATHVRAGGGSAAGTVGGTVGGAGPDLSLADLALDLDPVVLDAALAGAFASAPFEDLADAWLLPSSAELGTAWQRGTVSVVGEHVVSASVHRHLAAVLGAASPATAAPRAGRARPLLAARARGARLRRGAPPSGCRRRLRGQRPADRGVGPGRHPRGRRRGGHGRAHGGGRARGARRSRGAGRGSPALPLYVGGAHQDRIADPVRRLGHAVVPAARVVARPLGLASPTRPAPGRSAT